MRPGIEILVIIIVAYSICCYKNKYPINSEENSDSLITIDKTTYWKQTSLDSISAVSLAINSKSIISLSNKI